MNEFVLMNGDTPVLIFNLEDMYISVLNNKMLPYELKDYVQTTDLSNIKKTIKDITVLKDFFVSRTLNLSREHAKEILNVANLPQSLKTDERLKITFACKGLTMTDNFWIKKEGEALHFADVNLRNHKLSDASYEIAIIGKQISATSESLRPDLATGGMFPKFWKRNKDGNVSIWKTDKSTTFINSKCEVLASELLLKNNFPAVKYKKVKLDGRVFSVCDCIATDDLSVVPALSIKDWCAHTNKDFINYVESNWMSEFANMCIADFVIANTDRHIENWHFYIKNDTNDIVGLTEMFDFNHALISDEIGTDISELIYPPTGLTFNESVKKYAPFSTLSFKEDILPLKCLQRWEYVKQCKSIEFQSLDDVIENAKRIVNNSKQQNCIDIHNKTSEMEL